MTNAQRQAVDRLEWRARAYEVVSILPVTRLCLVSEKSGNCTLDGALEVTNDRNAAYVYAVVRQMEDDAALGVTSGAVTAFSHTAITIEESQGNGVEAWRQFARMDILNYRGLAHAILLCGERRFDLDPVQVAVAENVWDLFKRLLSTGRERT